LIDEKSKGPRAANCIAEGSLGAFWNIKTSSLNCDFSQIMQKRLEAGRWAKTRIEMNKTIQALSNGGFRISNDRRECKWLKEV
jgi:hypothetical protein